MLLCKYSLWTQRRSQPGELQLLLSLGLLKAYHNCHLKGNLVGRQVNTKQKSWLE